MGLVTVTPTTSNVVMDQYKPSAAKPNRFYSSILWGGAKGPFTVTRRDPNGQVSFLLQPPLTVDHLEWVTEYPPLKRVEAADGAFIDNPTPVQALEFLHHHVTSNVMIYL